MKHYVLIFVFGALMIVCTREADASDDTVIIAMIEEPASNAYYVDVQVEGMELMRFLVDTGSSYTVINEETLGILKSRERAHFLKHLTGTLADGARKLIPVYRLAQFSIGNKCTLDNVEVAVLPGKVRQILGLSALKQAAPFVFSTAPPSLALKHCGNKQVSAVGAR